MRIEAVASQLTLIIEFSLRVTRNRQTSASRSSFVFFDRLSPKSVKISVGKDQRSFETGQNVAGKTSKEERRKKKEIKEKMRSKPDECMRMCVIVGKSDWTRVHARKDHERET